MSKRDLTAAKLRQLIAYDPGTGKFTWKAWVSDSCGPGYAAGTRQVDGYVAIQLRRHRYYAHQLAWLYVYGEWPARRLNHINRDRGDNRIDNLRLCGAPQ